MSFVAIELNIASHSIASLNAKLKQADGNANGGLNELMNLLNGLAGGAIDGVVQVTVRDSTSSIATSGSGSTQVSYDLS